MERNEIVTVTAEAIGTQGEGIAKCGDVTLFVPYLLPGERARVKILKVKGNIGYGKVEDILTPAEERVRPHCPVFYRCGGCQLQHLRYRDQLKFKTSAVRDALRKIGGIEAHVAHCERSDREYAYRNKLQLPVGRSGGETVFGFYAERSHRIVPTDTCPIHPAWADEVIAALKSFMEKCGLDGYDEESKTGQIRHIVVRELRKKFIVTLVVTVPELKGIGYFTYLLDGIFSDYSLFLNFNSADTNVVFGKEFRLVKGSESYECTDMGITFSAGPNTFVQVNDGVRGRLYSRAVELAAEGPVIDCYAGGGLLTALFAAKYGRAYGIEVIPEAVACADALAEKNGLGAQMTNLCGRVEDLLGALLAKEKDAVVVLDPPRQGVERSVLKTLLGAMPKRILMISCNPATLARDLGILTGSLTETEGGELTKTENGHTMYEIGLVQPYDMFPQTRHVETLAVLERK